MPDSLIMMKETLITFIKKKRFEKILHDNLDNLMQLAYMKCMNKELAEDLVQDTCIKAYNSYLTKDKIESPRQWLYTILTNTHIDHLRKKQVLFTDIEETDFISNKTPDKETESNLFMEDLQSSLNELDEVQRTVIYLSDVNEYSYKEIAETLNIPLGTVMSRLFRARQTLRKHLAKKGYSKEATIGGKRQ